MFVSVVDRTTRERAIFNTEASDACKISKPPFHAGRWMYKSVGQKSRMHRKEKWEVFHIKRLITVVFQERNNDVQKEQRMLSRTVLGKFLL